MINRRGLERRQTTSPTINGHRGKKIWSEEEDQHLKKLVELYGTANWTLIAQSLPERSGKQCRERFHNHLDHGIKKGDWTEEEDRIIIILQKSIGNQWAKITKMLPGRTDNAVKNRFHATERAKSRGKLDESFLADPTFTEYIIKEALRLNGELEGFADTGNVSDVECSETSAQSIYPLASAIVRPPAGVQASPAELALAEAMFQAAEEEGSETLMTEAVPVNINEEEDYEVGDMEVGSVAGLMELDIISIDEDDLDFENVGGSYAESRAQESNSCFSFNWSNSSKPSFSPERKIGNFCGLESWGMARAPAVPQQIGMGATHNIMSQSIGSGGFTPQHNQQQQQQSHGFSFGYNPTTFFCSR